jgi:hypothetical protein
VKQQQIHGLQYQQVEQALLPQHIILPNNLSPKVKVVANCSKILMANKALKGLKKLVK